MGRRIARGCEYYKPKREDIENCVNCQHWGGQRCKIEDKLKRDYRTDLNHGPVKRC